MSISLPNKLVQKLGGQKGPVHIVRLNENGNYCFSGGRDRAIHLWNPLKGKHVYSFEGGHGFDVTSLAIDTSNSMFASGGMDKLVLVWDIAHTRIKTRLRGHSQKINCLAFDKSTNILASGSSDKTVRLWDMRARSFTPIQILTEAKDGITSIEILSSSIVTSSIDGSLRTYDLRTGKVTVDSIGVPITSMAVSHDRNCFIASCLSGAVHLVDRISGDELNQFKGHKHEKFQVECCFSEDDSVVICGSEDGKVFFWDLVEGTVVCSPQAHTSVCSSLCYGMCSSLGGLPLLVTASADGSICVWSDETFVDKVAETSRKETVGTPFMETRTRLPLLFT